MSAKPSPAFAKGRKRLVCFSLCLSVLLAACNKDSSEEAPPTALPFTVEVQGPATQNALGTAVVFSANVADPSSKLKYEWQFGDGETSTAPNPSHTYAKAGVYRVQLVVTNEAGASRVSAADVSVSDSSLTSNKVCSGENNSGWCWQMPMPTGNFISDVAFIDEQHGWAVGQMGTILATSDGGATWQQQRSGTELMLNRVVFKSAQRGWILADGNVILNTEDGGKTWTSSKSDITLFPNTFSVADVSTAWSQGRYSIPNLGDFFGVLITRDSGRSWLPIEKPQLGDGYVARYFSVNTNVHWAEIRPHDSGNLVRTINGGYSWQSVSLPPVATGQGRYLKELFFAGENNVWWTGSETGSLGYRETFFRSLDGGNTWQTLTSLPSVYAESLQFANANVGAALSRNILGGETLIRTRDGGISWENLRLPYQNTPPGSKLTMFSENHWLLNSPSPYGRAFFSYDAGSTWQERPLGGARSFNINGLWFFDNREGIATGSNGSISRTLDGGQTWVTTEEANPQGSWSKPQFLSDGSGWMLSDSGKVYRSTDKGKTWISPVFSDPDILVNISDYHFVNAKDGWAVKPVPTITNGKLVSIFRTSDGGLSWTPLEATADYYGLQAIHFLDSNNGFAVGGGGVVRATNDGGVSWSWRNSGVSNDLYQLAFVDTNTIVAVGSGGVVLRSSDRGQTWKKMASATTNELRTVQFISPKIGWAAGTGGIVIMTRDGGLNWSLQTTSSNTTFGAAFFINEQTGWIGGSGGTIMATATGGR